MVRTVFPTGISRILAVAIQADQKIVAAGRATGPNLYDFALARYNVDGSLDLSFGSGGMAWWKRKTCRRFRLRIVPTSRGGRIDPQGVAALTSEGAALTSRGAAGWGEGGIRRR